MHSSVRLNVTANQCIFLSINSESPPPLRIQSVVVTLLVNDEASQFTSTGEFVGLDLDGPVYVAGAPEAVIDDAVKFGKPFQGELS